MVGTPHAEAEATQRKTEFDYLRAFVIVLVVWHHAVLAYAVTSFINPANPIETFSPVADLQRWIGFDIWTGFNDTFFMALMFFISGLFVWRSLRRKGTRTYLIDRLIRLGIPFVVLLVFVIPLAYYPAQLTVELVYGGSTSYWEFWRNMALSGFGTAGSLWFLWLLLVFDVVVALLYRVTGSREKEGVERSRRLFERPLLFFFVLAALTAAAYLPLGLLFGPLHWTGAGPFRAQTSRILFYLVYFLMGAAVGAYGIDRSVLRRQGPLARRWWIWLPAGFLTFVVLLLLVIGGPERPGVDALAFIVSCATLVLGFTALFVRFATRPVRVLDALARDAFGIYLVHYVFVTWLQYGLLGFNLPSGVKAVAVFVGSLLLSWGLVAVLRRIPAVDRVI